AADPHRLVVGARLGQVLLDLLAGRGDAAGAADRHAQPAVGAQVPVLGQVGAAEHIVPVGADVFAVGALLLVGVQVPALFAVDLGMAVVHQHIHGDLGKDAHGRSDLFCRCCVLGGGVGDAGHLGVGQQESLHLLGHQGGGHSVGAQHLADLGLGGVVLGGQPAVLGVHLVGVGHDALGLRDGLGGQDAAQPLFGALAEAGVQ